MSEDSSCSQLVAASLLAAIPILARPLRSGRIRYCAEWFVRGSLVRFSEHVQEIGVKGDSIKFIFSDQLQPSFETPDATAILELVEDYIRFYRNRSAEVRFELMCGKCFALNSL